VLLDNLIIKINKYFIKLSKDYNFEIMILFDSKSIQKRLQCCCLCQQ